MKEEDATTWKDFVKAILFLIVIIVVAAFIATHQDKPNVPTNTSETIDSILNTNDSIKVVIKYIDSTKQHEIEKVLKLDNDSTLELFKQLVRE